MLLVNNSFKLFFTVIRARHEGVAYWSLTAILAILIWSLLIYTIAYVSYY